MLHLLPWKYVPWNLMLAVIPVVLAYMMAAGAERWTLRRKKIPWIVWLPLALAWLVFLPNTCYLLTEWRHFLFDPPMPDLIRRADSDRGIMLDLAAMGLFYLVYSGMGVLLFTLSIRPVAAVLRRAGAYLLPWGVGFFLLTSLGVYLGLIVRLNSWDLLTRPDYVWDSIAQALGNARLVEVIVLFAGFLWLLYETVNLWVDGVVVRIGRRLPGMPWGGDRVGASERHETSEVRGEI